MDNPFNHLRDEKSKRDQEIIDQELVLQEKYKFIDQLFLQHTEMVTRVLEKLRDAVLPGFSIKLFPRLPIEFGPSQWSLGNPITIAGYIESWDWELRVKLFLDSKQQSFLVCESRNFRTSYNKNQIQCSLNEDDLINALQCLHEKRVSWERTIPKQ